MDEEEEIVATPQERNQFMMEVQGLFVPDMLCPLCNHSVKRKKYKKFGDWTQHLTSGKCTYLKSELEEYVRQNRQSAIDRSLPQVQNKYGTELPKFVGPECLDEPPLPAEDSQSNSQEQEANSQEQEEAVAGGRRKSERIKKHRQMYPRREGLSAPRRSEQEAVQSWGRTGVHQDGCERSKALDVPT